MAVIRGSLQLPSQLRSDPSPPRRTAVRGHLVEVVYPAGIEAATLVTHNAESALVRFPQRTAFTVFVEHNARYDYRISVRSTGSADGDYRFLGTTRMDDGGYTVALERALHHDARNVEIGAECRFGDRRVTGVMTSLSAVGGTLRLPLPEHGNESAVVSFELKGMRFQLPSDLEHGHHELVTLAFRPLTAEPLEALAGLLKVKPPPAGHLSLGYISRHVVRERMERVKAEAVRPTVEEKAPEQDRRNAPRVEQVAQVEHRVLWEQLAPERVITTRR